MDEPIVLASIVAGTGGLAVALLAILTARAHGRSRASGRTEPADPARRDPLVDPETGLCSSGEWEEVLRHEAARFARYRRPVTIVVAELDGLDSLAATLGQAVADRLIRPVAEAMRRNARDADIFARTGHARFVALLPETDEVTATNYIERVRSECDSWLEAGALAVRLAVGWAEPADGGQLTDAVRMANDRMNADRRRGDFRSGHSDAVRSEAVHSDAVHSDAVHSDTVHVDSGSIHDHRPDHPVVTHW